MPYNSWRRFYLETDGVEVGRAGDRLTVRARRSMEG